jgi:hypothetical protein
MNARKYTKPTILAAAALASVSLLTACGPGPANSDVASRNLSTAADNFEIPRRIVVFNGITDKYLMTVEGKCSINDQGNQLEITCRVGPDQYKKNFAGLSDNVSYFVEQQAPVDVSVYHYRVIYKPETVLPEIEIQTGKQ